MAELIAQGTDPRDRWRRALIAHVPVFLGRTGPGWEVPWDKQISRQHVHLLWDGSKLTVKRLPEAHNAVFLRGKQRDLLILRPGEHFVIGGTTFLLVNEHAIVTLDSPPAATEQAFSSDFLHGHRYRDAHQRIEVLSRLPEIIQGASDDRELFVRLVSFLLTGISSADTVAIVSVNPKLISPSAVRVLHWDRQSPDGSPFTPSGRLICRAVGSSQSVLYMWHGRTQNQQDAFTQQEDADWAFCTPVLGEACRGWSIYVAGRVKPDSGMSPTTFGPDQLQDDVKFTELAASTLQSLREMRMLQQSQTTLRQFFSPIVLNALAGRDPEQVLTPREAEVCVLFCDLRGFSLQSERQADDLLGLLNRVSRALGVMTHHILKQGGVVGDFHGDAAMGFWGWPLKQENAVELACRAALGIRTEFERSATNTSHPLTGFQIGIGMATGHAVAGKIGTVDQVKVTVFGPVVNLAARLETMTRVLHAPILIDGQTARRVRGEVAPEIARVRRVATVRPFGMKKPVEVNELLPPQLDFPQLTDVHIQAYETALDALQSGDWEKAFQWLHHVPAEDRVKDFLTVFVAKNNRTPPDPWDGVIPLESK